MGALGAAGGFLLFVAIGALYSLYGPIIPTLRASFDIGVTAAGLALSAHFAGAMAGIGGWALGEARWGSRPSLKTATTLVVAGALGFAVAPAWPLSLAAAATLGVGFGALVVGLNRLFATGFGARSAAMLNLLGASFGCGAITGPLALSLFDGRFRLIFIAGALLAAVALPLALRAPQIPPSEDAGARMRGRVPARVWGFVAFYVLYVGVESGIGGWEATHLLARGASGVAASNWTAAYWAAITVGRVLAAPIALRVSPDRLVTGALVLTTLVLGLAHLTALTAYAYVGAGLALAPVFPTGLAWLTAALPSARGATAMVVAGAQLGGVLLPPVIGALVAVASAEVIPTSLVLVAAACSLTVFVLLQRHGIPGRTSDA